MGRWHNFSGSVKGQERLVQTLKKNLFFSLEPALADSCSLPSINISPSCHPV